MDATTNVDLLGPLVLEGPAVAQDESIRDKNHMPAPSERQWIENMRAQNADISAAEVRFFEELDSRA